MKDADVYVTSEKSVNAVVEDKDTPEVQKFANEQVGRRRRDDYTDGAVRIPVNSANP